MRTRRDFLTTASAALLWTASPRAAAQTARVATDPARLRRRLELLSRFGRPAAGTFVDGVSRVAYSDADLAARAWLLDEIRGAGFAPRVDAAGNIFARHGGQASAPPILFGSHIDSVPNGGNFDGDLGTLAALDVLETVKAAGRATRHPLEMVVWAHEESTAFGRGTACSRIVAGDLKAGDLDQEWNGMRRRDALRRIGGDPERIESAVAAPGAWHAYVELHIEQGGTLDAAGVTVGVVEGIVAIHRYDVTIDGVANHAGTTPMDARQDALVAASQLVLAVRRVAASREGRHVGTVGRLDVHPNSPNVVPGRVTLSVEFRDLSPRVLDALGETLRAEAAAIARDTRTTIAMRLASTNPPAPAHTGVMAAIQAAATRREWPARVLPSGAGHDAQMIAALCPMGMIFVPSVGGISHSPRELTRWDDCARGADTLLDTVLALDGKDSV